MSAGSPHRPPARRVAAIRAAVVAVGCALGAALLVASAAPASAHAYIVSTSPADGASVASAPGSVSLTFDEPVSHVVVVVDGPDGDQWQEGAPKAVNETVTQALHPLGPAGKYAVDYRVVSVDGHTVQGSMSFTLTSAGSGTPAKSGQGASTGGGQGAGMSMGGGGAGAATGHGGLPLWPLLMVIVIVAAAWIGWSVGRASRFWAGRTQVDERLHEGES